MATECTYQFATSQQAGQAIEILLDAMTGGSSPDHTHDAECVTRCCAALASFGMSKMVGQKPAFTEEPTPTTTEERKALLQRAKDNVDGVGFQAAAFPWMLVIDMLAQFLKEWLGKS